MKFPETLFVIDEAYIEFYDIDCSLFKEASVTNNLLITRTFSKAFGLAGIRVGYAIGTEQNILNIEKIHNPKNLSMISQTIAAYALENFDKLRGWIDEVKKSKLIFCNWLEQNKIYFIESHTNFVVFDASHFDNCLVHLKSHGIYARPRSKLSPNFIRITIGSTADSQRVIDALSLIYKRVDT